MTPSQRHEDAQRREGPAVPSGLSEPLSQGGSGPAPESQSVPSSLGMGQDRENGRIGGRREGTCSTQPTAHSFPERRSPADPLARDCRNRGSCAPGGPGQTRAGVLSAPGRSSPCFYQHPGHPAPWPPGHVSLVAACLSFLFSSVCLGFGSHPENTGNLCPKTFNQIACTMTHFPCEFTCSFPE